jgi:hypothetical protein
MMDQAMRDSKTMGNFNELFNILLYLCAVKI